MKTFTIVRNGDESGVSGTGRILDGIIFHNGKVVVCWRTDIDGTKHGDSSIGIYESFGAFRRIHIDSHPDNKTEIHFNPETNELLDQITEQVLFEQVDTMDLDVPTTDSEGKRFGKIAQLRLRIGKLLQNNKFPIDKPVKPEQKETEKS